MEKIFRAFNTEVRVVISYFDNKLSFKFVFENGYLNGIFFSGHMFSYEKDGIRISTSDLKRNDNNSMVTSKMFREICEYVKNKSRELLTPENQGRALKEFCISQRKNISEQILDLGKEYEVLTKQIETLEILYPT